jgi:hypothetical protein
MAAICISVPYFCSSGLPWSPALAAAGITLHLVQLTQTQTRRDYRSAVTSGLDAAGIGIRRCPIMGCGGHTEFTAPKTKP